MGWCGADGIEDEVDDSISEESDDETKDSIEDGVFGVGDLFAVATRDNVAETAPDQHQNGDCANDVENSIGNLGKDTIWANEVFWHAVGTSCFGAFLNSQCHSLTSAQSNHGADASGDL